MTMILEVDIVYFFGLKLNYTWMLEVLRMIKENDETGRLYTKRTKFFITHFR